MVRQGELRPLGEARTMRYARIDRALGLAPQMLLVGMADPV